jgi:hypothetical protein
MKKVFLAILFVVSLLGAVSFIRPARVYAAAPDCFRRVVGSGGAGPVRNAQCNNVFKQAAAEEFNRQPQNALLDNKCYMMASGNISEVGRNGPLCRGWRDTNTDTPGSTADNDGGDITIGILDTKLSSGEGRVCGEGENKVNISFNLGCRGVGNPIVDLLFAVTRFLSIAVGITVVGSIILGGIQYSASAGKPEATAKAVARISNSVLALIIYLLIFAILNWLVPSGLF